MRGEIANNLIPLSKVNYFKGFRKHKLEHNIHYLDEIMKITVKIKHKK